MLWNELLARLRQICELVIADAGDIHYKEEQSTSELVQEVRFFFQDCKNALATILSVAPTFSRT